MKRYRITYKRIYKGLAYDRCLMTQADNEEQAIQYARDYVFNKYKQQIYNVEATEYCIK